MNRTLTSRFRDAIAGVFRLGGNRATHDAHDGWPLADHGKVGGVHRSRSGACGCVGRGRLAGQAFVVVVGPGSLAPRQCDERADVGLECRVAFRRNALAVDVSIAHLVVRSQHEHQIVLEQPVQPCAHVVIQPGLVGRGLVQFVKEHVPDGHGFLGLRHVVQDVADRQMQFLALAHR